MRPQATFSFFIFLQLFHFFTLIVAPSSPSLLPPRRSFLLVAPFSLFLFLHRPALSRSLRIHKRPFFIKFDESVTNQRTDGRTDKASCRDARTHLKRRCGTLQSVTKRLSSKDFSPKNIAVEGNSWIDCEGGNQVSRPILASL